MKPTIGRVVWFYQFDGVRHALPRAAVIADVASDTLINLMMISANGAPYQEQGM